MRVMESLSPLTRSRFFPNVDEENLFNRIDLVLRETGFMMDLRSDLRFLMYISNSVDNRLKKRLQQQKT